MPFEDIALHVVSTFDAMGLEKQRNSFRHLVYAYRKGCLENKRNIANEMYHELSYVFKGGEEEFERLWKEETRK